MKLLRYKHILLLFIFIMLVSFITFYSYMTSLPQENSVPKPKQTIVLASGNQIVKSETKIYIKERYAICEEYDLNCENETIFSGPARADLDNITIEELQQKYPEEAGWEVIWQENKVLLQQSHQGLCPLHQKRWHLGLDETGKKVVVYTGPAKIGDVGGIVKETNIVFEELPFSLQEKIREQSMEFIEWDELIGTLDSLDEYYGGH